MVKREAVLLELALLGFYRSSFFLAAVFARSLTILEALTCLLAFSRIFTGTLEPPPLLRLSGSLVVESDGDWL